MHDPSDNPDAPSKSGPQRLPRTESRRHYFHFATGYVKSAHATLVIAGKPLEVIIPEQTQYGFTAIGTGKVAEGLRLGARWVLVLDGNRFEVFPQWIHCAADGRVQIGLRRMQQLSSVLETGIIHRLRSHFKPDGQWAIVMAILVLVLSSAWLMRQIYQPPEVHARGQAVRLDSVSTPHD
ncbi:MAG TPA: hypothetical protein DDZ51_01090 [Planctomycetaceae bacterium]|nr:hypothetical protein [Planctomycetaceae bacterium]